jgi:hypothetical protein
MWTNERTTFATHNSSFSSTLFTAILFPACEFRTTPLIQNVFATKRGAPSQTDGADGKLRGENFGKLESEAEAIGLYNEELPAESL